MISSFGEDLCTLLWRGRSLKIRLRRELVRAAMALGGVEPSISTRVSICTTKLRKRSLYILSGPNVAFAPHESST